MCYNNNNNNNHTPIPTDSTTSSTTTSSSTSSSTSSFNNTLYRDTIDPLIRYTYTGYNTSYIIHTAQSTIHQENIVNFSTIGQYAIKSLFQQIEQGKVLNPECKFIFSLTNHHPQTWIS